MLVSYLFISQLVSAWGYDGHEITAEIANEYLTDNAKSAIDKLLDGQSIVEVASWADKIKRQPKYNWSGNLHYVNPKDNEPELCSFDYVSDCPNERCVVGAIYNFTNILNNRKNADVRSHRRRREPHHEPHLPHEPSGGDKKEIVADALKFLVHFVGDIHQPLHVTGRSRGGNDETVLFARTKMNLHGVWDSKMLFKRIDDDFGGSRNNFVKYLIAESKKVNIPTITSCSKSSRSFFRLQDLKYEPEQESKTAICPDVWAKSINRLNCESVWIFKKNEDLSLEYFNRNVKILDNELIVGGLRLAAVLNEVFA